NYEGKARAAVDALQTDDFVYLHVEASDEAGHDGSIPLKLDTIRSLDSRLLAPILAALDPQGTGQLQAAGEPVAIALLPDHPTPCHLRTHTGDPVPFAIYAPGMEPDQVTAFDEEAARQGAYGLLQGEEFIRTFMGV
ncbi:MAG TPA: phosphoglycerate mutase, partial [Prevotellaceae bacterium]|nr:phosphoglycerate mutase [Prevotellaceae bacterium]